MKKSIILFLLFGCLGLTQAKAKIIRESANKDKTYIKIWVDGLACPFCAYGLEKKMKKLEGIKNLYVDLNNGFITFETPTEKIPSEDILKKLIKEAGFVARKFEYAKVPFKITKKTKD
jgi:copper chaperone CopZ